MTYPQGVKSPTQVEGSVVSSGYSRTPVRSIDLEAVHGHEMRKEVSHFVTKQYPGNIAVFRQESSSVASVRRVVRAFLALQRQAWINQSVSLVHAILGGKRTAPLRIQVALDNLRRAPCKPYKDTLRTGRRRSPHNASLFPTPNANHTRIAATSNHDHHLRKSDHFHYLRRRLCALQIARASPRLVCGVRGNASSPGWTPPWFG